MTAEENKISILKKYITEFVPPDHKVSQVTPSEFDELSVEGYLQPFLNSMQEYSDQQTKELREEVERLRGIKSGYVFVRYKNWEGDEKTQALKSTEEEAIIWIKECGFEEIEIKEILFNPTKP